MCPTHQGARRLAIIPAHASVPCTQCHAYLPLALHYTPVALNIKLKSWKSVDDNMHAQPSRWEGSPPSTLYHQVPNQVEVLHVTIAHVQYILPCLWLEAFYTSAHVGRMACIRARPCWGVGGDQTPIHTKRSHAMLWHSSLPRVSFNNSWLNKTSYTCWPRYLANSQKLDMCTL